MNSYLGHLVQRSRDHNNRLRPRVPSLFEPAPERVGLSSVAMAAMTDRPQADSELELTPSIARPLGESSQTYEDHTPVTAIRPLPSMPGSDAQGQQHSGRHPEQRMDDGETATSSSQVSNQTPNTASPSPQSVSSQNVSTSVSPPLPAIVTPWQSSLSPSRLEAQADGQLAAFPEMPSPQTQPVVPASSQPYPPTIIERRIETITPTIPSPISVVPPSTETIGNAANPSSPGAIKSPMPLPSPAIASVEKAPNLRPAIITSPFESQVSETPPISSPVPPPAPTIQVTIGRIEVRATTSAPKPRKSRPAPPVMSLNDYLQQRGGGK